MAVGGCLAPASGAQSFPYVLCRNQEHVGLFRVELGGVAWADLVMTNSWHEVSETCQVN